ncbi:hypothetical protein BJ944DRAFT_237774 [Cunninghamella echinulata]|nr:hypothetical protein BJ944DRAFT_237774 [Cunninghamella echinulata]
MSATQSTNNQTSQTFSSTLSSGNIPQLVVIQDQIHNTYKHPILHYVFEDESLPDIPKDKLIVVDFDTSNGEPKVDSYSPNFQVSQYRLEQSTVNDRFDQGMAGLFNLILEGVSAPQANEAIESLQSIKNVDNLKETLFNFKNRNDMVKKIFEQD